MACTAGKSCIVALFDSIDWNMGDDVGVLNPYDIEAYFPWTDH